MFKSQFEKVLDKATSHLNVEPELTSLIQLCDLIRSGEVSAKAALNSIRKKLENTNQHVVQHSLIILESCAKNCGSQFHEEMASREFNDFMKDFVRRSKVSEQARTKMLELIQSWQHGFRQKPEYHIFVETYNELKSSGMQFPAARDSDAMFDSASAPSWKDGAQCYRCRTNFGTITRKHHCRNCGQVFCNDCTSRYCPIPKYGIEKDVRVCDKCYDELHAAAKRAVRGSPEHERSGSVSHSGASSAPTAPASVKPSHKPTEAELKAEEEFETQLAIALSLSAQEETKKQQERRIVADYLAQTPDPSSEATNRQQAPRADSYTPANGSSAPPQPSALDTRDMDAELAMYLNRNFWQQRSEQLNAASAPAVVPSAPMLTPKASIAGSIDLPIGTPQAQARSLAQTIEDQPEEMPVDGTIDELSAPVSAKKCAEEEQFVDALRKTIQIFTNRVRSNRVSVRNVTDDTSVQSLFTTVNRMLPELKALKDKYAARKAYYESLQDKLNEIRDGRQVLDAMRNEAAERRRRAEEEAARQRQLDMLAKLEQFRAYKQQMLASTLRYMEEQQRFGSLYGLPASGPNALGNPNYMPPLASSQQYAYAPPGQPNNGQPGVPPGQSQYGYAPPGPAFPYASGPTGYNTQNMTAPPDFSIPSGHGAPQYAGSWPASGQPPSSTASFPAHSQPPQQPTQPIYAHAALPTNPEPVGYQPSMTNVSAAYPQSTSQPAYSAPSQPAYAAPPTSQPNYAAGPPPSQPNYTATPYGYQAPATEQQFGQAAPSGYGPPAANFQPQAVVQQADVAKTEEQLISFD